MPLNTLLIVGSLIVGSVVLTAAKPKPLPIGSCIANSLLCNANDPNIDPWEVRCYSGAILRIEKVGKRSYKTGCMEETLECRDFVSFEDVKALYFPIECPAKIMKLHNSIPLPKE